MYNFEYKYHTTCSGGAKLFVYSIFCTANMIYELSSIERSVSLNSNLWADRRM